MVILNDLIRTKFIELEPLAGDDLNEMIKLAAFLSKSRNCKVKFWFDAKEYLADEDGNCAKLN